MNNKGILKEEVKRILEMMEVSEKKSQLLNEGIIDDVVQGIVKVGTKSGDDVLTVLAKLEDEIGIRKGVLDSDDILDLIKGSSDEQITVLSKIVRNLGPAQLDTLSTKVWSQLKDVHTNMLNGVTSIKSSGGKITSKDIDEMSEIAISSTKPGFDPLINALRKEFKTKMTKSLEGYIDASGSAGKINGVADEIPQKPFKESEESIQDAILRNGDEKQLINEFRANDLYRLLNSKQKGIIEDFIKQEKRLGKSNVEIEIGARNKVSKYISDAETAARLKKDVDLVGKIRKFRSFLDAVTPGKKGWLYIILIGLATGAFTVAGGIGYITKVVGSKEDFDAARSEDPESPNLETSTYTNDLTGFKKWSNDNGYTDAEISGGESWYKDGNGEWQQAFYSNNSWN